LGYAPEQFLDQNISFVISDDKSEPILTQVDLMKGG
jgi:hypothetical protein